MVASGLVDQESCRDLEPRQGEPTKTDRDNDGPLEGPLETIGDPLGLLGVPRLLWGGSLGSFPKSGALIM